jgi:hypothetical protein
MDSRLRGNDGVFGDGCVTIKGARSSDARAKKTASQRLDDSVGFDLDFASTVF